MIKAALFDLDGTLTDSMNLSAQAFIHTLKKHLNQDFTPDGIFAMFGPGEEVIFNNLDPKQAPQMMATFLDFYRTYHHKYADIYPGVMEMLDFLHQKHIPMAVITGKGKLPAQITIDEFGLSKYFQNVVTGSCVKKHKPDPEGLDHVLDCLGVKPQETFYLGDSPGDIETSRRAGVKALAALWGARDPEFLIKQNPDESFANPGEFLTWLKRNI